MERTVVSAVVGTHTKHTQNAITLKKIHKNRNCFLKKSAKKKYKKQQSAIINKTLAK
jgi:hypothetical protein